MNGKPIRVRITGDLSKPSSIDIVDADTGAKITNVLEVDIHASRVPGDCRVTLTLHGAELDVTGELRITEAELENPLRCWP